MEHKTTENNRILPSSCEENMTVVRRSRDYYQLTAIKNEIRATKITSNKRSAENSSFENHSENHSSQTEDLSRANIICLQNITTLYTIKPSFLTPFNTAEDFITL